MGSSQIIYEWTPLEGIGPFVFNEPVEKYASKFSLFPIPDEVEEDEDWETYGMPGDEDARFYFEDGLLESVIVSSNFFYNNANLIGLPPDEALEVLEMEPDDIEKIDTDEGEEDAYSFYDVNLQFYVLDGVIDTVLVGRDYEDYEYDEFDDDEEPED
ncbi:conserved hypothetical protein [Desulfatibacillum aliphaticivorans]|uniref:Uncharacterized protein n=1 Tax=Desulfatibacillum aliphaticivorans TaxID=218208 RepID=B8FBU9_DESAL|nr:hypothetical protein [Desulfatibacillum aliphaticivorans]ACL05154.1 conserved hypothetical protein [Desulfatibacillum aliphaticivorans]